MFFLFFFSLFFNLEILVLKIILMVYWFIIRQMASVSLPHTKTVALTENIFKINSLKTSFNIICNFLKKLLTENQFLSNPKRKFTMSYAALEYADKHSQGSSWPSDLWNLGPSCDRHPVRTIHLSQTARDAYQHSFPVSLALSLSNSCPTGRLSNRRNRERKLHKNQVVKLLCLCSEGRNGRRAIFPRNGESGTTSISDLNSQMTESDHVQIRE